MTVDVEALGAHRHAIAVTIPVLDAIRSIAEMAFRRGERAAVPVAAYADHVRTLLAEVVASLRRDERQALLESTSGTGPVALLMISAERGLCGAFNDRLVARVGTLVRRQAEHDEPATLLCWGNRGKRLLEAAGHTVAFSTALPSFALPGYADVEGMALDILALVEQRAFARVVVVHNAPVRRFQYATAVRQLLPPEIAMPATRRGPIEVKPTGDTPALVTHLLTEYLLIELYRAVVESSISEQLARVATMRLAADNARRLLDALTADYNRARQYAVTNALLEIVAGYQTAEGTDVPSAPDRTG